LPLSLADRRVVNEFETKLFPALKHRVEEAAGFAVPLEIHWDTLAIAGESRLFEDSWPKVYFEPLIGALQTVGDSEMGREAIKTGIKKIVVQNAKSCIYPECWSSFLDGVLTLDHDSITNVADVAGRRNALVKVLENSL
jgi:hypothetical protein